MLLVLTWFSAMANNVIPSLAVTCVTRMHGLVLARGGY